MLGEKTHGTTPPSVPKSSSLCASVKPVVPITMDFPLSAAYSAWASVAAGAVKSTMTSAEAAASAMSSRTTTPGSAHSPSSEASRPTHS